MDEELLGIVARRAQAAALEVLQENGCGGMVVTVALHDDVDGHYQCMASTLPRDQECLLLGSMAGDVLMREED